MATALPFFENVNQILRWLAGKAREDPMGQPFWHDAVREKRRIIDVAAPRAVAS